MDKESLFGTWRLVQAISKDSAGNLLPPPYGGPEAMALLSIRMDGRMVSVLCDSRTNIPTGEDREYTSYCGKFSFDGTILKTRVDACSDPNRFDTDQVREVRMEKGLLVLRPPPQQRGDQIVYREMFWEKIAEV